MLPTKARSYLMEGLSATPVVIEKMISDCPAPDYDRRPDPSRFTLREVLGHLADWEGVWLERATKMRDEENPSLPGYDEGQWAIDHDYAHMDPAEQVSRFRAGRRELLAFLKSLSDEQWDRTARHGEWGDVTIASMATLVLGHDGYHTKQIAEWLTPEL